jgi:hypothetical protein
LLILISEVKLRFGPARTDKARGELLSWMFFVSSGVGPYFGQSVHFRVYAPEKISYATNRYAFEAQRILSPAERANSFIFEIRLKLRGERAVSSFTNRRISPSNKSSSTW